MLKRVPVTAILDAAAPEYEVSVDEKPGYGTELHERLSPRVNEYYDLRLRPRQSAYPRKR